MINSISLIGFKSFLYRDLNLNRLTVLTGLNSSGKSSIIQALLMLEKAANADDSILLEGHGSIDEIKNNFYKNEIAIGISNDKGEYQITIPSDGNYKETNEIADFPDPRAQEKTRGGNRYRAAIPSPQTSAKVLHR